MSLLAIVKTGGKQYIVKSGDQIVVDHVDGEVGSTVELTRLANFATDGSVIEVGVSASKAPVKAEIVESAKGEKIRVAKFKAKVRYRKVMGFRAHLTKLKIVSV